MSDDPNKNAGESATGENTPTATKKTNSEKEVFTKEYVSELRGENATWRTKAEGLEKQLKQVQEDSDKKVVDADTKAKAAHTSAQERIIRAELKALAVAEGIVDVEGLKLADLSKVKLNEDGELEGGSELIKDLKEKKAYLFGEKKSTTNPEGMPKNKTNEKNDVTKMSREEYDKYKLKVVRSK